MPLPYLATAWFPSGRALDADARFTATIGNLAERPRDLSATAAVTSSDGANQEFTLSLVDDGGCWSSSIALEAPNDFTPQVLELGPSPYDVVVHARFDGAKMTAPAVRWPDAYPANSNEGDRISTMLTSG